MLYIRTNLAITNTEDDYSQFAAGGDKQARYQPSCHPAVDKKAYTEGKPVRHAIHLFNCTKCSVAAFCFQRDLKLAQKIR